MINITRIKWMIKELKPNEEYIQWVEEYSVRVAKYEDLASINLLNTKSHRQVKKFFSLKEIELSKFDFVSYYIDRMVTEINS